MNEAQKQFIRSLVVLPGHPASEKLEPREILERFGADTDDAHAFCLSLLQQVAEKKDAEELEYALILCSSLNAYDESYIDLLIELSGADWHKQHENIVQILQQLKNPKAVDALYHLTQWLPEYMNYDEENRSLARKALFALGDTPGEEAKQTIQKLLQDNNPKIRELAQEQIDRQSN